MNVRLHALVLPVNAGKNTGIEENNRYQEKPKKINIKGKKRRGNVTVVMENLIFFFNNMSEE